jgi:hypothetical protein
VIKMPAYSTFVGARDVAVPQLPVSPRHRSGTVKYINDFCAVPANFASGDYVSFGQIPANATILPHLCRLYWGTALGAGRLLALGTNDLAGAFASAIDGSVVSGTAGAPGFNRTADLIGKFAWEHSGLSADPKRAHDLRVTLTGGAGPASIWNLGLLLAYI